MINIFYFLLISIVFNLIMFFFAYKFKKDKRFDGMREDFFKFLRFWVLQGVSVWIIILTSVLFLNNSVNKTYLIWIGLLIWICGISIETISDIQKFNFN